MMVEIMSMGEISKWYGDCIKESDKKEIARYYGIPARVLESFNIHGQESLRPS